MSHASAHKLAIVFVVTFQVLAASCFPCHCGEGRQHHVLQKHVHRAPLEPIQGSSHCALCDLKSQLRNSHQTMEQIDSAATPPLVARLGTIKDDLFTPASQLACQDWYVSSSALEQSPVLLL